MCTNYTIIQRDSEINELLYEKCVSDYIPKYIFVGNEKICMPYAFSKMMRNIRNFEVRDDDVFITSFPRSGTTWTQETVWMIMNNGDKERAKECLNYRSPFFEISAVFDCSEIYKINSDFDPPAYVKDSVDFTKNAKSPRIIKTHLPWNLMPKQIQNGQKKPKIINVTRNPKDVCVSYYYHSKYIQGFDIDNFEDYCTLFMNNLVPYGPYFYHITSYFNQRNSDNFIHITYEEMSKDLSLVIQRLSKFLNNPISKDNPLLSELLEHLSFENMKKNPSLNVKPHLIAIDKVTKNVRSGKFIRKGVVGGYKEEMSEVTIKRIDKWIENNYAKVDGLKEFIENT